jgi:hypothetical protein
VGLAVAVIPMMVMATAEMEATEAESSSLFLRTSLLMAVSSPRATMALVRQYPDEGEVVEQEDPFWLRPKV